MTLSRFHATRAARDHSASGGARPALRARGRRRTPNLTDLTDRTELIETAEGFDVLHLTDDEARAAGLRELTAGSDADGAGDFEWMDADPVELVGMPGRVAAGATEAAELAARIDKITARLAAVASDDAELLSAVSTALRDHAADLDGCALEMDQLATERPWMGGAA